MSLLRQYGQLGEMIPLQNPQSATLVSPEPPMPKPRPAHPGAAIDPEWRATAQAIGYAPSYVAADDFLAVLARLEIPVYDYQEVDWYLAAAVARLNANRPRGIMLMSIMWSWRWEPLRDADAARTQVTITYAHPVPLHALRLVEKIIPEVPEATFFVSNIYQRPKGDPFLAVQPRPGMAYYVIDQWDEPSFTGRAK